jgi:general secretion pathway protein J
VRDILGSGYLPAFASQANQSSAQASLQSASSIDAAPGSAQTQAPDDAGTDMVIFTRAGWANPAGIQRPELERVSYRLVDGTLRRLHWAVLDGTETSRPQRRDLLSQVKSVKFRFMDNTHQWITQWPPTGQNQGLRTRPLAVEVTLELADWGSIVRVIEVPT